MAIQFNQPTMLGTGAAMPEPIVRYLGVDTAVTFNPYSPLNTPIQAWLRDNLNPSDPTTSAASVAPQLTSKFIFDTIGQTIYRSIGHVALPLRLIWVLGINNSGDTATATMTAAYALCAPLDPDETGSITTLIAGSNVIYDPGNGGIIIPDGMDAATAAAMTAAIQGIVVYPGDEAQDPAPLIVADKGSDLTPAFRGLRYIILPGWPLSQGIPTLSAEWTRSNDISISSVTIETPFGDG